jgi:hypothetical protein
MCRWQVVGTREQGQQHMTWLNGTCVYVILPSGGSWNSTGPHGATWRNIAACSLSDCRHGHACHCLHRALRWWSTAACTTCSRHTRATQGTQKAGTGQARHTHGPHRPHRPSGVARQAAQQACHTWAWHCTCTSLQSSPSSSQSSHIICQGITMASLSLRRLQTVLVVRAGKDRWKRGGACDLIKPPLLNTYN